MSDYLNDWYFYRSSYPGRNVVTAGFLHHDPNDADTGLCSYAACISALQQSYPYSQRPDLWPDKGACHVYADPQYGQDSSLVSEVVPAYRDVTGAGCGDCTPLDIIVTEWNDLGNDPSDVPPFQAALEVYAPGWSSYFPWDTRQNAGTPGIRSSGILLDQGRELIAALGGVAPPDQPCEP